MLGYASAGVKITLINVNDMRLWDAAHPFTPVDMELLNKDQFHTMHHEFSHILHQTKTYPVTFGQVTPDTYEPRNWQNRDSVESVRLGYITQYGSSAIYEDFVETLSCAITDTDCRWMHAIISACANGHVKSGDKEAVYELIDSLEIQGLDDASKNWNKFTLYKEMLQNTETKQFEETGRYIPSFHQRDVREKAAADDKVLRFDKVKDFTSFRDFLDNWVTVDNSSDVGGINALLKKYDIATKWYTEKWGLYLFRIRHDVRERQNNINEYVRDNVTIYDYQ